jgi:hypothetical protein
LIETGQDSGEYQVSARLVQDHETLAESVEVILALPALSLTEIGSSIQILGEIPEVLTVKQTSETQHERTSDTGVDKPPVLLAASPASLTEKEWDQLLNSVEMGQVAIMGPLHKRDELAQRMLNDRGIKIQLHYGIGNWMGCYHWIPASDLFADLPARRVAGEAYVDVLPRYVMSELGGEVLAGSIRNTQTRREAPAMIWYSDIEVIRFGTGTLFFCQYRIFDQAHANPLAARLAYNLIHLAQNYLDRPYPAAA